MLSSETPLIGSLSASAETTFMNKVVNHCICSVGGKPVEEVESTCSKLFFFFFYCSQQLLPTIMVRLNCCPGSGRSGSSCCTAHAPRRAGVHPTGLISHRKSHTKDLFTRLRTSDSSVWSLSSSYSCYLSIMVKSLYWHQHSTVI